MTVVVEGTSVGTTTNAAGAYSISAGKDAKLVFSFIGMENQTVPVSGKSVINVQMKEDAIGVDEVVVTAMGITRSENRSATRYPPSRRTKSTRPAKATSSTRWPVKSPA
ncbi:MAG: carboxypeptidase-like regulatory domain-containing protein [Alistipes senegalensis]